MSPAYSEPHLWHGETSRGTVWEWAGPFTALWQGPKIQGVAFVAWGHGLHRHFHASLWKKFLRESGWKLPALLRVYEMPKACWAVPKTWWCPGLTTAFSLLVFLANVQILLAVFVFWNNLENYLKPCWWVWRLSNFFAKRGRLGSAPYQPQPREPAVWTVICFLGSDISRWGAPRDEQPRCLFWR